MRAASAPACRRRSRTARAAVRTSQRRSRQRSRTLGRRRRAAGTIRGVLWHQGESDADAQANAETYKARLTQMFKDLRTDLNLPELPIVVGQVGDFLPVEKHPYVETVRAALRGMPEALPRVGYADAKGLTDKGDALHFTAASQVTFGTRYAEAMLTLQAARAATQPAPGGRR